MCRLADSSPWFDGVRYSAWLAGGPDAVDAIHALVQAMCNGECHAGLHDALYVFLPKTLGAEDGGTHAAETRPLGLKDTGVKIATTVTSRAIAPVIAANAAQEQRGFLFGKELRGQHLGA